MFSGMPANALRRTVVAFFLCTLAVLSLSSSPRSLATPSRSDVERAEARLAELERDFEIVVERYNQTKTRLEELSERIDATEREVARLRKRIDKKRDIAIALAEELYKEGGGAGAIEAVLSSESISDLQASIHYLAESDSEQTKIFERLAIDRQQLSVRLRELSEARADARASKQRLAGLKESIVRKISSQRREIARLNAAIERAERLRELRERRAEAAAEAAQPSPSPSATPAPSASPTPPSDSSSQSSPAPSPSGGAATAVSVALAQVGKPYQWGAAGPDAFDCSGLTMYAWAAGGVSLPHSSAMQYSATARVSSSALQPGDLLFYGSPIHHVAMYVGGGRMVEAPYSGLNVRVVSGVFRSDFVGAGRP